jgi:predicted nucleic acid-binding protein
MCIVIDTDVFSAIANKDHHRHDDLAPVIRWISFGKGKLVHGGKEYKKQLEKNGAFSRWMVEMQRNHKTAQIESMDVDRATDYLTQNMIGNSFDDHHLAAILIVSGCQLVASFDKGFHKLLTACYCQPTLSSITSNCVCATNPHPPKVYQKKNHSHLLCDRYLVKLEHVKH